MILVPYHHESQTTVMTFPSAAGWPLKEWSWMPHLCPGEHCAVCRWDRQRKERHGEARPEATEAHEEV